MKFAYLTLFVGIAIACVAAWFSIVGLVAIFSASWIGVLCMGVVVESGKVVGASWLSRYWDTTETLAKTALKWILVILVAVAMVVTSAGIFGYLSKAHVEQQADMGSNSASIARLDRLIEIEQRDINDSLRVLDQLDAAVQTLIDYDRIRGPEGAKAVRESQKEERAQLKAEIKTSQEAINALEEQKFELNTSVRELKTEVGPVLYIAALIYDDPETHLDSAVRAVIIVLICIFDPLAIVLILAANHSLVVEKGRQRKEEKPLPTEPDPMVEEVIEETIDEAPTVAVSEKIDITPVEVTEEVPVEDKGHIDVPGDTRMKHQRTSGWLNNSQTPRQK